MSSVNNSQYTSCKWLCRRKLQPTYFTKKWQAAMHLLFFIFILTGQVAANHSTNAVSLLLLVCQEASSPLLRPHCGNGARKKIFLHPIITINLMQFYRWTCIVPKESRILIIKKKSHTYMANLHIDRNLNMFL